MQVTSLQSTLSGFSYISWFLIVTGMINFPSRDNTELIGAICLGKLLSYSLKAAY